MITEGTFYLVVAGWLVLLGGIGGRLRYLYRRRAAGVAVGQ